MFLAIESRLRDKLGALRAQISLSAFLRDPGLQSRCASRANCQGFDFINQTVPDQTEWKVFDHCALFNRLYALYESFVHQIIEEIVSFYQTNFKYAELPSSLRDNYRIGFGTILQKLDGPRYDHIDFQAMTEEYNNALRGEGYRLEPSALVLHDANLRLSELESLLSKCAITELRSAINEHRSLQTFFNEDRQHSTAEAQLKALVQYRNDASHGSIEVDDILSERLQLEYVDFVEALGAAIASKVRYELMNKGLEKGVIARAGTIAERFRSGTIIVGHLVGDFRVGGVIFVKKDKNCIPVVIEDIQFQGITHTRLSSTKSTEIGLRISGMGKVGDEILIAEEKS